MIKGKTDKKNPKHSIIRYLNMGFCREGAKCHFFIKKKRLQDPSQQRKM